MTVFQVEAQVREEAKGQSAEQLARALADMGQETEGLSRDQLIDKLVEMEVYAFTH
jgi:hypothetical protein